MFRRTICSDPEAEVPFAEALYGNDKFMRAFFNSLSDDGILVMQLGEAPTLNSPDETHSKFKNRERTTRLLEKLGFQSIHAYEEVGATNLPFFLHTFASGILILLFIALLMLQSHCGFRAPWTYVIGFKSYKTRQRWYANAAQIDLEGHKRGVRAKSGERPFRYFDGPTMVSYQVPHKTMEAVFCKRQPTPEECLVGQYAYDPALPNIPASSFEVKRSKVADDAGRGIFTNVDIPEDAYLSAETNVRMVEFMPSTVALIQELAETDMGKDLTIFNWYMNGYGFYSRKFVSLRARLEWVVLMILLANS